MIIDYPPSIGNFDFDDWATRLVDVLRHPDTLEAESITVNGPSRLSNIVEGYIGAWQITEKTIHQGTITLSADDNQITIDTIVLDGGENEIRISSKMKLDADTERIDVGDTGSAYIQIDGANCRIKSSNYVSGYAGAGFLLQPSLLEVGNIACRGIFRTAVFQKDIISVVGGNVLVMPGDVLSTDMTADDSSTLTIEGNETFAVGDLLRIKDGADDEWFEVTDDSSAPTYTVTRDKDSQYGADANPEWEKGASVVNYRQSADGGIYMTSSEATAPYLSVIDHAGSPWSTINTRLRMGNLNGFLDYSSDLYGIAIGETDAYLKYDSTNGLRVKGAITVTGGDAAQTNQFPSDDNLVLHIPFDERSGTIANDLSGNGLDATLYNTPAWSSGQSGTALDLNTPDSGTELVTNGGFESGDPPDDWTAENSADLDRHGGDAHSGSYCLEVNEDGGVSPTARQDIAGLTADRYYLLTLWVKEGTAAAYKYRIVDTSASPNASIFAWETGTATSDWVKVQKVFQTPSGCTEIRVQLVHDVSAGAGTSVLFDDVSVVELKQYAQVSHDSALDFTSENFSISCWVKPSKDQMANVRIVSKCDPNTSGWEVWLETDQLSLLTNQAGDRTIAYINVSICDDSWHHIVVVRNGSDAAFYVDNVSYSNEGGSLTDAITDSNDLYIGVLEATSTHFSGLIDELRIYNTALTAAEVRGLYNYPAGAKGEFARKLWAHTSDTTLIDGGDIYAGSITLTSAGSDFNLASIAGDLDDITNGTTYGKVNVTSIDGSGIVILSGASGDLDDISDGTSYGKVLSTQISAGEIVLSAVSGDLDDISDGTNYGKVASTAISAGKIVLTAGTGVEGSLPVDNTAAKCTDPNADETSAQFTDSLGDIENGASYARTGLDSNGNLVTKAIPASNASPSGAGLYLGADYLGYYDASNWKTYMDNSGNFYLGGAAGALQWNGTTLSIEGSITVTDGSGIASFSDAGSLATAEPADINTSDLNNDAGWTSGSGVSFFSQSGIPTATAEGDLWQDTDNEYLYRAASVGADQITSGEWELVTIEEGQLGTTVISGGKIVTGLLTADNISAGTMSAARISGGTIGACTISASNITTGSMSAARITAGTMSAARISGGTIGACTISGTNISAGTLYANRIVAGNITATQISSTAELKNRRIEHAINGSTTVNSNSSTTITHNKGRVLMSAACNQGNYDHLAGEVGTGEHGTNSFDCINGGTYTEDCAYVGM